MSMRSLIVRVNSIEDLITQITGLAPETLNTLQKLAESINNDNTFYNTLNNQLSLKATAADVYSKSQTYTQYQINSSLSGNNLPLQHQQIYHYHLLQRQAQQPLIQL